MNRPGFYTQIYVKFIHNRNENNQNLNRNNKWYIFRKNNPRYLEIVQCISAYESLKDVSLNDIVLVFDFSQTYLSLLQTHKVLSSCYEAENFDDI